MKHFFFSLFFLFTASFGFCFGQSPDARSWKVLVSIAPHKYFVERIAEDTVKTLVLIPPGANAHTFEPTLKQILAMSNADLWFRIGEPMENNTLSALQSHNSRLKPIDLRKGIDLITSQSAHKGHIHANGGADLHFWLSPRQAKIQAKTIADALIHQYPENAQKYQKNLESLLNDLDLLDKELAILLNPLSNRTFFVSHPAYGYFARDYDLIQLSIEFEGKDPAPQQLTKILENARKLQIKKIFIQPQFQNKGARLIAKELDAELITIDPYSEKYLEMMRELGQRIAGN